MTARDSNMRNAFRTQLTAAMQPTDLTATVGSTTGLTSPCYLVIEPRSGSQREYIYFDGVFTTTTVVTLLLTNRYLTGSAAGAGLTHPVGSEVWCVPMSQHFEDIHDRIDATAIASGITNTPAGGIAATTVQAAINELDTEKVNKATLDANTILYATVDDTPAALAVAASRIVGRKATGDIGALTAAEVKTVLSLADADIQELARDALGTALTAGAGVTITPNDGADTITIASSGGTTHALARKTADESVTSSTTLQNDDDLLFAIAANEVWVAEFVLRVFGATTGDIKFQVNAPAGATGWFAPIGVEASSGSSPTDGGTDAMLLYSPDLGSTLLGYGISGADSVITIKVYVANSSTAGNVQLQWAQLTSDGTATKVKVGSHLIAHKVA